MPLPRQTDDLPIDRGGTPCSYITATDRDYDLTHRSLRFKQDRAVVRNTLLAGWVAALRAII